MKIPPQKAIKNEVQKETQCWKYHYGKWLENGLIKTVKQNEK